MKILIVEDEHRIATALKKGLEQEKFIVDLAFDGIQGYDQASTQVYDLILLDLMLPGIDGLTVCQKLRSQNIHTPILMLTAKSQTQDKIVGLNGGADDYLSKPFAFEELLARIRSLLRRPPVRESSVLSVADLSMNLDTFDVKRGSRSIRLSTKEYALLEYLLRHSGKIIGKQQIIDRVWEYDTDILPNTVEVYVKNLRQKLGKPNLIHTIRGFGYKLSV